MAGGRAQVKVCGERKKVGESEEETPQELSQKSPQQRGWMETSQVSGSNLFEVQEDTAALVHKTEYGGAGRVCGLSTVSEAKRTELG